MPGLSNLTSSPTNTGMLDGFHAAFRVPQDASDFSSICFNKIES